MTIRRRTMLPGICLVALLATCGDGPDPNANEVVVDTLTVQDTIISTASELIGGVIDLAVGTDGRLYLADYGFKQILSVTADGTDPRTFGREGSGPGEFQMPWSIAVAADSLRVFDMRQARIQTFDLEGQFVASSTVPASSLGGGRALNESGQLAVATGGLDSMLVVVLNDEGEQVRSFGCPVVPAITYFDFGSMKERIREGVVPDEWRNNALPVWRDDGSVFVAFYAEPEIRLYGVDGALLWSRTLTDPVLETTRATFIRKNVEESNPARLHGLNYVVDAASVGEELWLLLNTEESEAGILLVLEAADGSLERRVVLSGLPGAAAFAVDTVRDRMYVAVRDEAMIVAVGLE